MAKELLTSKKSVLVSMADHYSLDPETFKRVIKATCGLERARDEEFMAFITVAHEYRLNPLTREIYAFVKSGGGIQPIVAVDGWIKKMNEHPAHDGVDFREHLEDGHLVATTAIIHRKDRSHPTEVTEFLHECRRNTDPWKQMPARMLRHKALIQCIRVAYNLLPGAMDEEDALELKEGADGVFRHDDLPRVNRSPSGSGAAAGATAGTERVEPLPSQDGGRKTKAPERSAASTPPPPITDPEEKPISTERQKDLIEQADFAGMSAAQLERYVLGKYKTAGLKLTPSQADEVVQYLKSRGTAA
jgi:phage recombination protein Bet